MGVACPDFAQAIVQGTVDGRYRFRRASSRRNPDLLLVVLSGLFVVLTAFVVNKSSDLQMQVEEHYSALAERASDTLGNVPLLHSFVRVQDEVSRLKDVIERLLAAQLLMLSWWAVIAVLAHDWLLRRV
jgi:ABC-type multidrug transport system fused ATPase/permease subunit